MTTSSPSVAAAPGFASAEHLPTGTLPTAVASGDFNEDGKLDLAISNGADDTVTVLLNDGAGGFVNPPGLLYNSGSAPVWLTAAKLSATGHTDIVTVDGDSNQVEIFRGNGDGTFHAPSILDTLTQIPTYVTAGDFNKDGYLDLAVGLAIDPGKSEPTFFVYLGDGTGAFPTKIAGPTFPNWNDSPLPVNSLAISDLNKDGYPDITVGFIGEGIANLNQGGTGFTASTGFGPTDGLLGLAVSDVDGDGCPDAIQAGSFGLLTISKGGCNGTFAQSKPVNAVGDQDPVMLVTDVDGDGLPDIVAAAAFFEFGYSGVGFGAPGGYTISVFKGTGNGSFARPTMYRGGANQYALIAADLTGSGVPDLVAVAQLDNAVIRLRNDGQGNFGSSSGETIGYLHGTVNAPSPISSPQVVDLNGDGRPDVLLIESGVYGTDPGQITSLLNDGKGMLLPPVRTPISSNPNSLYDIFTAADFRSSQKADAVLVGSYTCPCSADFYPANGDGTFGTPTRLGNLPNPLLVSSGDVNHDGKMDFVVYGSTANQTQAEIDVFLGNGDGTFRHLPALVSPALVNLGALPAQQIFIEDFNHDGKPDILLGFNLNGGWTFTGDDLELALGNGDGTFQNPRTLMPDFGPVAVGDLNHDGYPDLVQVHDPGQSLTAQAVDNAGPYTAPAATIYLGQAGGSFVKGATYIAPQIQYPSFAPALLGDFNGDGILDIAIPYASWYGRPWSFQLLVLGGVGDGTFRPSAIPYQLPVYDKPVIGGDFSGTGRTDLLDLIGSTSSINILSAGSPQTVSVSFDALPLPAAGGSITVNLASPARAGESVALSSSDPAVDIPASVSFPAGATQQSVSYTIGPGFDKTHMLAIGATRDGYSGIAYGSLPSVNRKAGVQATIGMNGWSTKGSAAVAPGGSVNLVFSLMSEGGYSGNFENLTCTGLPPGATCTFVASSLSLLSGGSTDTVFSISTSANTPMGVYHMEITATNGALTPSAALTFGVGTFTISASPTTIPMNDGTKQPYTTLTANYQNGYGNNNTLDVSCSGLPAGANCSFEGAIFPGNNSGQLALSEKGLPAGDYPFTITATGGSVTRSIAAVLRVESFTGSLDQTTLQSTTAIPVTATVTLKSVNHFTTNSIQLACQSAAYVTCTATPFNAVLTDDGTATVQLAITGTMSAAESLSAPPWVRTAAGFTLACLMLPFALTRKASKAFAYLLLIAFCVGISSCSGGSSMSSGAGGSTGSGTGTGSGGSQNTQTISVQIKGTAATVGGSINQTVGTISLILTR